MRVEVRALIRLDGRVAVNEERRHGLPRLSLPGGRIDRWESTEEALVREVREELGVEVDCGAFICAFEVVSRFHIQDLNLVFEAVLKDPMDAGKLTFVDPADEQTPIFPPILDSLEHLPATGNGHWLGNVWRPDLRTSA